MPATLLIMLTLSACGEDPVLEAARQSTGAPAATAEADASEKPSSSTGKSNRRRSILDDDAAVGNPDAPVHEEGAPGEPPPGEPGEPPPGEPGEPPPGEPGTPPPGELGEPGPGIPEDPTPGVPDEPPPDGGYRKPPPIEGPTVIITGSIELPDWYQGSIRIDVFDGDQLQFGGPRPGVVTMQTLAGPGPFELEVPESVERVWLSAYNDEDMDGRPGPVDPTGYYAENPVVLDGVISGIAITLDRRDPPGGEVDEGL